VNFSLEKSWKNYSRKKMVKSSSNHPRIVFFGTPFFGRVILENLLADNFKVVGVVTQPDKPIGREQKMTPSPVKILAKKEKIPVLTPTNKQELMAASKRLLTNKPDLFVIAAYGMIIPAQTLSIPKRRVINVHPSLLPKYRGASPIQAAILRGGEETGVTIMLTDEEMDHGPILSQQKTPIAPNETTPSLTEKLALLGGQLLTATIPSYIKGEITPQSQNHELATFTKLIKKEDGRVEWKTGNDLIERMVRAYNPWPGVWTTIGEMANQLNQNLRNPKHENLKLKILTAHLENGTLSLDLVQVEGKKPISFADFSKGYLKQI